MWFFVWLLASPGHAYEPIINDSGNAVRWKKFPVTWQLNEEEIPDTVGYDKMLHAVQASIDEWEFVEGSELTFEYLGSTDVRAPAHDEINTIYWEPDWTWDDDILALTSTWSTTSGEIVGFDIRINTFGADWSEGKMDLQNALTHEVGHGIGLDHTPDYFEATMYASTRTGEIRKRDLHWDDEEGTRYLYGNGEPVLANLPGGCATQPFGVSGLLLGLTGLFLRRRKGGTA